MVLVSRRDPNDPVRWVYLDIGRFGGLAETEGEAIKYRITTPHDGTAMGPVAIAGPTCDGADILYEKSNYRLPLALTSGDTGGAAVDRRLRDDLRQPEVQRLRAAGGTLPVRIHCAVPACDVEAGTGLLRSLGDVNHDIASNLALIHREIGIHYRIEIVAMRIGDPMLPASTGFAIRHFGFDSARPSLISLRQLSLCRGANGCSWIIRLPVVCMDGGRRRLDWSPRTRQQEESAMASITVQASDGTGGFSAYLVEPKSKPAGVVVLIQEIFGVNQAMRDIAAWVADIGFIAVCPDLFWRIEPGIDITDKSEAEWKKAFELFSKFDQVEGHRGSEGDSCRRAQTARRQRQGRARWATVSAVVWPS